MNGSIATGIRSSNCYFIYIIAAEVRIQGRSDFCDGDFAAIVCGRNNVFGLFTSSSQIRWDVSEFWRCVVLDLNDLLMLNGISAAIRCGPSPCHREFRGACLDQSVCVEGNDSCSAAVVYRIQNYQFNLGATLYRGVVWQCLDE